MNKKNIILTSIILVVTLFIVIILYNIQYQLNSHIEKTHKDIISIKSEIIILNNSIPKKIPANPQLNYNEQKNNYIDILEKTNQQISLWYTPYNLMISILVGLITIIGIAVAIYGFIFSRENKRQIEDLIDESNAKIDDLWTVISKQDKNIKANYDQMIKQSEDILNKIKKASQHDSALEEFLQTTVDGIKAAKQAYSAEEFPFSAKPKKCSYCNQIFKYNPEPGMGEIECPYCKRKNIVRYTRIF
jgi:hypothetical protein